MKLTDPRLTHGGLAAGVLVLLALSWQYGFLHVTRAYQQSHERIALLMERVAHVEATVREGGGQAKWLAQREQDVLRLKGRVPPQAQLPQALNALVDALRAGDIKLVNVTQGTLEPVREADTPLAMEGAPCLRLPVTVTAEGKYHAVVTVLEQMTNQAFPMAIGIERVELQLKDPAGSRLNATLQLNLYVVGSSTSPVPSAVQAGPPHA